MDRCAKGTFITVQPGESILRGVEEVGGVECHHAKPCWVLHGVGDIKVSQPLFNVEVQHPPLLYFARKVRE